MLGSEGVKVEAEVEEEEPAFSAGCGTVRFEPRSLVGEEVGGEVGHGRAPK